MRNIMVTVQVGDLDSVHVIEGIGPEKFSHLLREFGIKADKIMFSEPSRDKNPVTGRPNLVCHKEFELKEDPIFPQKVIKLEKALKEAMEWDWFIDDPPHWVVKMCQKALLP